MGKDKSVATTLNAYYRNKGEKMPRLLKVLIFNYNIQKKPFHDLVTLSGGDDDENPKGDIDGDEEKKEVIKFILDPENAFILGQFGHHDTMESSDHKYVINVKVYKDESEVVKMLLY